MSAAKNELLRALDSVRDMDGELWIVLMLRGEGLGPTISLRQQRAQGVYRADYCLATLMETLASGEKFVFGGPGCGDTLKHLAPPALAALTAQALRCVPVTLGEFEVKWRPYDSEAIC
ncbi:hypothetical protein [Variovorax sp. IB41]|uniref:hypothetical protein n=1 Tax=Variovorax sp. IB41 TaxID=2779370 RepID=UPI0018E7A32E|nr:hypothetical protein [Variovorax sp. IB41]MBJ2155281.1 hypothetical protein [Variovorax sp. IB41]